MLTGCWGSLLTLGSLGLIWGKQAGDAEAACLVWLVASGNGHLSAQPFLGDRHPTAPHQPLPPAQPGFLKSTQVVNVATVSILAQCN